MELTVLGCSGSYGAPAGGACSGYLVRAGDATIWMDCGNGTFANLQEHIDPAELSAVVITHGHADHCVDLYGLHVMFRYGLELSGLPVYTPEGLEPVLAGLVGTFGDTFDWRTVGDGDHASIGEADAAVLAHRPPAADDGRRDRARREAPRVHRRHRAGMERRRVRRGRRSRAVRGDLPARRHPRRRSTSRPVKPVSWHARAKARRLMITHLWPTLDPLASVEEASEAFGREVSLAAPHLSTHV